VARCSERAERFDGGADDAEDATARVDFGQVNLLDGAQSLGGCCVAGQDDQRTALFKQGTDGLGGETIDHLEGARAVRGSGIVAQIEEVVFRQAVAEVRQDGEPAVAGVEDANGTGSHFTFFIFQSSIFI